MGKKNQIQDSPEYKYFEENFDALMSEMEQDKESECFEIPDEWDQRFRKAIDETIERERKEKVHGFVKVVGVVTAVIFVLLIGNFAVEQVNGEGLLEIFQNNFILGDKEYTTYGTNNEIELIEEENENIIYYSGDDLEDISEQIREEIKCPMFHLSYLPDGFSVESASYVKGFRIINIKLVKGEEYIYIFQQKQVDDIASGVFEEKMDENTTIHNKILDEHIVIYDGYQDNSWLIKFKKNNDILSVDALLSKEECIKIAENIDYY